MRSFNNSINEQQKSFKSDSIQEYSQRISSKINETQNQQLSNNNDDKVIESNVLGQRSKSQSSFIKSQVSNHSIPIVNQSYNDNLSVNRSSNSRTQTITQNPLKKSQFHIQNYSGYRRYEEPVQLNQNKNFMPLSNHISSSEILFNSGIYKKKYNENDSTKDTILMNLNTTLIDPSKNQSLLTQKPIKQQLDIIDEQINLENQRKELQKFSFQNDQMEQPYQRRASEILEEAARQLEQERNKPKPKEIHVIVNPYEITRQDILEKMINKDKQMREQEESIKAKELKHAKNKQAKDLLKFLGMKLPSDDDEDDEEEEQQQGQQQIEKDKSFNKLTLNPQIPSNPNSQTNIIEESSNNVTKSLFNRRQKKRQTTRVIDIINQMNSKTPQEQKIQMIKGETALVIKSQKNLKSTTKVEFEEDQPQQNIKTQNIIRGSQTSIQLHDEKSNKEINSAKQSVKPISDVQSPSYYTNTEIEDTKSVQLQMEQFLNRRALKQSFRLPLRYNSAIIKRAFEKQGQTYISKWLSHTTFTQTDIAEDEEDVDQTVIKNAAPGQQVILIETKPQVIKGRLNKFGKYKRRLRESMTNFEDEDDDPEEVVNKANNVNRKDVLKKRMRIQADVESKKEKQLAKRGRENQIQTDIPETKWEQKMVQLGKRKVRFKIENDLYQPDLDVGPDTIFKNPTFFRGLQMPKSGAQTLTSIGQSMTSFAQIDFEQEPKSYHDLDDKYNLMDVFGELYLGGDRKDYKLKQQWIDFLIQKDKMIDAFERMDGLRYRYPLKNKIEQDVRNHQIYEDIIKENEEEKVWKPDDQPQTDPPDQLKEFLIEPNILVYSKNILDLDMNYNKNKLQKESELTNKRRVAKLGLADEQTKAHQIQQLVDQSSQPSGDVNGHREIFDFMYKNYGDLPHVPMKTIQRIQDEKEQNQQISKLEKLLFEQTPAIPHNIHTNNNLFLVREVNEYENEIRQKKRHKESLSRVNSQSQIKEDTSQKNFEEANQKQKIQAQINTAIASVNPINFQFVPNDIKNKSIMKGVENVATKSFKNFSKIQDMSRQINSQIEAPSIQQTQNNIQQSQIDNKTQFQIQSLQLINNEPQQQQQIQKSNIINREQQIKTLKDLNEMYTTPGQLISQTLKTIKSYNKQSTNQENLEFDFRKNTNMSFYSNPDEAKQVIKNQYYVDHGSHLLNTQYDYNIPDVYHQREAEQGLFYLSKNYRDYFEPARDVFAEKDGWDILDQFAKNPKNLKTEKPSIHNYSQQKQIYDENDILTAFHGISVMNNCNKLFNDVEKRNEDNFRRRIYYNSSQ